MRGDPSPDAKTPPRFGKTDTANQDLSRSKASPVISMAAVAGKLRELEGRSYGLFKKPHNRRGSRDRLSNAKKVFFFLILRLAEVHASGHHWSGQSG